MAAVRYLALVILTILLVPAKADSFAWYGLVKDASGNFDTSNERVYEYADENSDRNYYYCFHAAIAGALNIRLGAPRVKLSGVHEAFSLFSTYRASPNRQGSLNYIRQLSFSDGAIPDLNAQLRQIAAGDAAALFSKIKEATNLNFPVVVAATQYQAGAAREPFTVVDSFSGNVGHALLITGYIETDSNDARNNLVAIRDPFLQYPKSRDLGHLFDYTISVKTLMQYLQVSNNLYDLMIFKTSPSADLKMLVSNNGTSEETSAKRRMDAFSAEYSYYFGGKNGTYFSCYGSYMCQNFSNGRRIATYLHSNDMWYSASLTSDWIWYGPYDNY